MNAATLSFLRHLAFWTKLDKPLESDLRGVEGPVLSPAHPDIFKIETELTKDFMKKFRVVKLSDVN